MPPHYTLVKWFIIGTFILWIAFDAWLGPNGGPTESQVIQWWAKHSTAFSWFLGALCGHWLLGLAVVNYRNWPWGFAALINLAIFDLWWWKLSTPVEPFPWYRWPAIWFLWGLIMGMLFWPQRNPDSPL